MTAINKTKSITDHRRTRIFTPSDLRDTTSVRNETNCYLAKYYAGKLAEASLVDHSYARLWRATEKFMMAGGKRLRPYLTVLLYKAFGGEDDEMILEVAVAQELLHGCLLIHDDIIDRDYVRYGVDNVAGQYRRTYAAAGLDDADAHHFSLSAALLAGDLLLSGSYEVIANSSLPQADKLQVQRSLQRSVFLVAGGELLDAESTFTPQDTETAQNIARLKTASYSFEGPMECGARLARAPAKQLTALREAGEHLGIAYQMYDDLLGVFGDDAVTGKSTTSDLAEGKRTVLLQQTLASCNEADRKYILSTVGKGTIATADAERIKSLMETTGAKKFVEAYADSHTMRARKQLQAIDMDPTYKENLLGFVARILPEKI